MTLVKIIVNQVIFSSNTMSNDDEAFSILINIIFLVGVVENFKNLLYSEKNKFLVELVKITCMIRFCIIRNISIAI